MSETNKQQQNNAPPNISVSPIVTNEIPIDANEMAANANAGINITSGSVLSDNMNTEQLSPNNDKKKAATKRTPSKRLSFVERAQKESEELVRNMGGTLELEGGRRTRSSARGTPTKVAATNTPPPAKKSRNSPSTNQGLTTPTPRSRGRGRKLDTTTLEIDEETTNSTTSGTALHKTTPNKGKSVGGAVQDTARTSENAPQGEETEVKVIEKVEETKQQSLSDEQEREQQSQSKAKEKIVPVDKDVETPDGGTVMRKQQQQLPLKEKYDATLNSVPEETSSQINEETEQMQAAIEELKGEDGNVWHKPESSIETDVTTKSNISSNTIESQCRQSPQPIQQQQYQQTQKVESETVLTAKSVKVADIDEEIKENESVLQPQPKTINEIDVDDEPMDVDSSSKSNDVVEIIESDSNMGESSENKDTESPKDMGTAIAETISSDNRSTTTRHILNETLTTGNVINITEDNCDVNNTNTHTNVKPNINATITIDIRAGGDQPIEKIVSETFNCNKSSASNEECQINSKDNEQNERKSSTSEAATTINDDTTMTPSKF